MAYAAVDEDVEDDAVDGVVVAADAEDDAAVVVAEKLEVASAGSRSSSAMRAGAVHVVLKA